MPTAINLENRARKGLLVVNSFLSGAKYEELYGYLSAAAGRAGISLRVISSADLLRPVGRKIGASFDFALCWDKDLFLCRALEESGVRVFNSSTAIAVCDDKALTAEALVRARIRTPRTVIAPKTFSNIGYNRTDFLCGVEKSIDYPMIIKQRFGSFGAQVYLAEDRAQAQKVLAECGGNEVLFQQFISESRGRDVRVNVVGDRICGCMLRYNENDFRSNITNGGKMNAFDPPAAYKNLALRACRAVGADFAGVDVLFGKNGPVICEVNASPHFKTTLQATGVNLADEILSYICGSVYR